MPREQTKLQQLASNENWAVFQLKGIQSSVALIERFPEVLKSIPKENLRRIVDDAEHTIFWIKTIQQFRKNSKKK
jgi:hypothetical protein